MITDDPQDMKKRLTQYVDDAALALTFLEGADPLQASQQSRAKGPYYQKYTEALNRLNTSRTWLGMAAEQLHDLLNTYHDQLLYAEKRERSDDDDE